MKPLSTLTALSLLFPVFGLSMNMEGSISNFVKTHPEVRKRVQNYHAVAQDMEIARAEYLPAVDLQMGIGYTDYEGPNTLFQRDKYQTRESYVRLRQNLFQGFGTLYNMQQQDARLQSAGYYLMESVSQIGLRTIEAHLEVLKRYKLLQLAQENLENHKRIHTMIQERTDSGAGPISDLEQVSGRLALAHSNLQIETNQFEDALAAYERVVGQPALIDELAEPGTHVSALPATLDEAVDKALENYPSALVSDKNIEAARASYAQSSEYLYPRVDLELKREWDRTSNHDIPLGNLDRDELSLMVIVSWNLYNGGADIAAKSKALSKVFQNNETLIDVKRVLKEQLQLSWTARLRLKQQIEYLQLHRDFSRKTVEAYNEEFRLGRRTLLDLLDVEIEYYTARKEYESARYDQIFATYRIIENTGYLPKLLNIDSKTLLSEKMTDERGKPKQKTR